MNRHNQYHVNKGNIPRSSFIGRSKFQYQNIHLNIGNVRWYYTVRWYSTKKYTVSVAEDYTELYHEIGDYIKKAPVNNDTQLKIENILYDYSYNHLSEKISNSS
jgi:hypothetical protein